jgi:hypothetical protein
MSSERNGPGGGANADDAPQQDSWFEPARRVAGGAASADGFSANGYSVNDLAADGAAAEGGASGGSRADEWFLRTGRAGLLPDSVTISFDDEAPREWRHEAEGAPPWAGDVVQSDGEPPPWESGPWPGPGEERPMPSGQEPNRQAGAGNAVRAGVLAETAPNWQARTALVTGILPLVVPGIVLGVLGLRRARYLRSGAVLSLLGIALSVAWAVILGFVLFGSSGSATAGCAVPSAVRASYAQVMHDLSAGGVTAVGSGTLASDAGKAASEANAAAVNAREVPLRGALAALAADLEQVRADLPGQHTGALLKSLRQKLSSDGAALSSACAR